VPAFIILMTRVETVEVQSTIRNQQSTIRIWPKSATRGD
jgi:hypothetical protein